MNSYRNTVNYLVPFSLQLGIAMYLHVEKVNAMGKSFRTYSLTEYSLYEKKWLTNGILTVSISDQ